MGIHAILENEIFVARCILHGIGRHASRAHGTNIIAVRLAPTVVKEAVFIDIPGHARIESILDLHLIVEKRNGNLLLNLHNCYASRNSGVGCNICRARDPRFTITTVVEDFKSFSCGRGIQSTRIRPCKTSFRENSSIYRLRLGCDRSDRRTGYESGHLTEKR